MKISLFSLAVNVCEFINERKRYYKKGENIYIPKYGTFVFCAILTLPMGMGVIKLFLVKVSKEELISIILLTLFMVFSQFFFAYNTVLNHIIIVDSDFVLERNLLKKKKIKILEIKECRIRPVKAYNISSALVIGDMSGNEIWINVAAYHDKDMKTLVTKLGYPDAIKYKEETKKQIKARKRKQRRDYSRWGLNIFIASSLCLIAGGLVMFLLVRVLKIDYFNDWLGQVLMISTIVGGYKFSSVLKKHTKKTKLSVLTLCALVLVALIVGMVFLFKRI